MNELQKIVMLKNEQLDSLDTSNRPNEIFATIDDDDSEFVEKLYKAIEDTQVAKELAQQALDQVVQGSGTQVKVNGAVVSMFDADTKADLNYVDQKVADLVGSAPEALNTLDELAEALKDNADIVTVLENAIANKADKTDIPADYLPLDGSKPMTGALDMNNLDLTNVNQVIFADPGRSEGIYWAKGNGWRIVECPNDITNDKGNIQFTVNNVRKATIDTNGNFEAVSKIMSKNTGKSERHYNNNSRVRPWHRIAYSNTNSNNYYDAHTVLLISKGYAGGGFGIVELTVRCNVLIPSASLTSGAPAVRVNWLAHQGLAIADLAFNVHYDNTTSNDYGTIYKDVVIDVFYNLGKMVYDGLQVYELWSDARSSIDRKWNLVMSYENTATDYKECWATLEDAALELHGIAAKSSGTSSLGGAVNYALQADRAGKDGSGNTITTSYVATAGSSTLTGSIVYNVKNSNTARGSKPSSTVFQYADYLDKDNNRVGVFGSQIKPDGYYGMYMQGGNEASIGVVSNGSSVYAWAPTPPAASNSTNIATTEWVVNLTQTAAQTISGNKTFTGTVIVPDVTIT